MPQERGIVIIKLLINNQQVVPLNLWFYSIKDQQSVGNIADHFYLICRFRDIIIIIIFADKNVLLLTNTYQRKGT